MILTIGACQQWGLAAVDPVGVLLAGTTAGGVNAVEPPGPVADDATGEDALTRFPTNRPEIIPAVIEALDSVASLSPTSRAWGQVSNPLASCLGAKT